MTQFFSNSTRLDASPKKLKSIHYFYLCDYEGISGESGENSRKKSKIFLTENYL
jgi:hypothetical protein